MGSTVEVTIQTLEAKSDCRITTEFDYGWGCVLGFDGSNEFAEIVLSFIKGFTSE